MMKQERSQSTPGPLRKNRKRLVLLGMLVAAAIVLSGCYMEPTDVIEGDNALTLGTGNQEFETIITPTPEVTATPTPGPTDSGAANDWTDMWTFDDGTATNPPSGTDGLTAQSTPNVGTGLTTPTPTPGTSGTASSETLREGSSGSAVTQLQTRLKELGYYKGTVDGKYGGGTISAVKAFQAANNLNADGIAGTATQEAVYGFAAIKASDAGSSSSSTSSTAKVTAKPTTAKATATPSISGRTDIYLRLGDSGAQVKTLQNRLIVLGYLSGTADSSFQSTTEAAVMAFQKRNSIYVDGVAGPTTLSKLYSSSAKKASSVVAHLGALKEGVSGASVRALQEQLKALGYYSGTVDGDYGAGTKNAVAAFQSATGLTADGVAGTKTMSAIYAATGTSPGPSGVTDSTNTASNPATYGTKASTNGYTTLTTGSSSSNITNLQSVLSARGFYDGKLDGSFGGGTTKAVNNYQANEGLRVTGMAGPATLRRLYGSTPPTGSYSKLEMGSTGSKVRDLQYTLYELMYYDGSISGTYDEATRNAVLLFQQVNGLTMDGVAGEATQRILYSSQAEPCNI